MDQPTKNALRMSYSYRQTGKDKMMNKKHNSLNTYSFNLISIDNKISSISSTTVNGKSAMANFA